MDFTCKRPLDKFVEELSNKFEYGDFLYIRFYNWFIYRLSAAIFVLKRANEYQADKESARLTSGRMLAQSLALIEILSEHEKHLFWDNYFTKTVEYEMVQPIYPLYQEFVRNGMSQDILNIKYNQILNIPTEYYDSHPCYLDRITAIDEKPSAPKLPINNAAEDFLGENLAIIPDANYKVGEFQLLDGDYSGMERIKLAINRKIEYFQTGSNLIHTYLVKCGKHDEAKAYLKSQESAYERFYNYYLYHNDLTIGYDKLSINTEYKDMIKSIISGFNFIKTGYLALKSKVNNPDYKDTYILILQLKYRYKLCYDKNEYENLMDEIKYSLEEKDANILIYRPSQIRNPKYFKAIRKFYGIKII
jgi:hypothetical protein